MKTLLIGLTLLSFNISASECGDAIRTAVRKATAYGRAVEVTSVAVKKRNQLKRIINAFEENPRLVEFQGRTKEEAENELLEAKLFVDKKKALRYKALIALSIHQVEATDVCD